MTPWHTRVTLLQDDIVDQDVDVIVNAANEDLTPGGGVCGAIHRAAGPKLEQACADIGGCPTGEAVITRAYGLPCRRVIHAVGPIWGGGGGTEEDDLLASCYRAALELAAEEGLASIAFPSISTGIYGFPRERACRVVLGVLADVLPDLPEIEEVRLVCWSGEDLRAYEEAWEEMVGSGA